MKRLAKVFSCTIAVLFISFSLTCAVFARPQAQEAPKINHDNVVETNVFGNVQDDGQGCGIYTIVNYAIDVLTWGIGIAALVGVGIFGIYYLTARGNEEQLTKSRHRIFEIIIGLALYAILYAGLNFLLPGGKFNTNGQCATTQQSSSDFGNKPTYTDHYNNGKNPLKVV